MDVTKEVFYIEYCSKCIHWHLPEADSPCDECLEMPVRDYSHKPLYFMKEDDDGET